MSVIELKNVKKSFKRQLLFENVSFSIEAGTITGFSGINGCGKSVLFKMIAGIYKPDEGEIIVRGKNISKNYDFPDGMGILIDEPSFVEIYSGYKNLQYLADIQNKIKKEKIIQTMEMLGLSPNNKDKVKNYSLGMKKKLGIAQAIMEDQDIIILDEPFNALDIASRTNTLELIRQLKASNKVILITNHNVMELEELCDVIYEIEDQKITDAGRGNNSA